MKKLLVLFTALFAVTFVYAQSKVFKEVSNDISSESKTIFSDNAVIGYVVFSQLEKASEDSFNYKLSIMDENLNDIGVVNFREIGLNLEAISFDQDVLCLGYIKSTELGKEYKKYKQVKNIDSKDYIMLQFINLDGKILSTENIPVSNSGKFYNAGAYSSKSNYTYSTKLKKGIQLETLYEKGFLLFYGDENNSKLLHYDAAGKSKWATNMPDAEGYYLNTAGNNIYMLLKNKKDTYGDYSFTTINPITGIKGKNTELVDKEGNQLQVKTFEPDPSTNTMYMSGTIINNKRNTIDGRIKIYTKAMNKGVFTIDMDSTAKNGMREKYMYWSDGSLKPALNKQGYSMEDKSYNVINTTYRDFNGNTYYVSDQLKKNPRIGGIVSSIILAPLIIVPLMNAAIGFNLYRYDNESIYKLTPKGVLVKENEIEMIKSKKSAGKVETSYLNNTRSNYSLTNKEDRTSFIISSDEKNTYIYNTEKHKLTRTVPLKKDGSYMLIGPAKEGHIMVIEKNKKEKYTRLSIEKLN
ncbi:hypothetical protein BH11BAC3_BH11BAC3_14920 [soil metagenome]